MNDTKHPLQSKTVWFGLALATLGSICGFLDDHSTMLQFLLTKQHYSEFTLVSGVVVIILRAVTSQAIGMPKG